MYKLIVKKNNKQIKRRLYERELLAYKEYKNEIKFWKKSEFNPDIILFKLINLNPIFWEPVDKKILSPVSSVG